MWAYNAIRFGFVRVVRGGGLLMQLGDENRTYRSDGFEICFGYLKHVK